MSSRRSRGSLREDLRRYTRERIVNAALEAFSTDGFRATTVEQITVIAGTTAPTFYRYFPSKRDLMIPLVEHLERENSKTLALLGKMEKVDFKNIRNWLDIYAKSWEKLRNLCSAYWEAAGIDADTLRSSFNISLEMTKYFDELFDKLSYVSDVSERSARIRVALFIPLLDRAMQVIMGTDEEVLQNEIMDEFAHIILRSISK